MGMNNFKGAFIRPIYPIKAHEPKGIPYII